MGTFKDVATSISDWFRHRIINPFFAAFIFSWLTVNWRLVLVMTSELKAREKIAWVDLQLFPDSQAALWYCLGQPLLLALIYILVAPPVFRRLVSYYRWQQNLTTELLQKIDGETPLSQDIGRKIRSENIQMRATVKEREREFAEKEESYLGEISALKRELARLRPMETAVRKHEGEDVDVPIRLTNVEAQLIGASTELADRGISRFEDSILRLLLVSRSSWVSIDELTSTVSSNLETVGAAVIELEQFGLVDYNPESGGIVRLSSVGRELATRLARRG